MSLPLNITADATAPKTFDLGMFLPDGHLRGSEVLGERLKGFTAGITQGLDVEGEKAGCLTSKIRTCEHLLADIGSTGIAIALSCQCCLGWFMSAGADGGDGWKKLVCPLKLWRKELFKYMSVGQAAAGSRGTTPLPPSELVTYFQLPYTS